MGRRTYDFERAAAVVFAGFAGACQPRLQPGDVVTGPVWTLDHIAQPAEKAALGARGVAAVDMETEWAAKEAAARGVPFRSVRVIIDRVGDRPLSVATVRNFPGAARALRRATVAALCEVESTLGPGGSS